MSRLTIARILIAIGLVVGIESLWATFGHIGDPLFTLPEAFGGGTTHAWYHVLRETMGDIGTIAVLILLFFGPAKFRNASTWWVALILMIGYYSPFWVGMPFNSALAAPTIEAEIRHIVQAAIPLFALFLARKDFDA
ncbi:MAG: hypothetical protein IIB77_14200 [Proteobacteria bacterium]|nr:hypothetical protein [Pseudomonadota bacterium]